MHLTKLWPIICNLAVSLLGNWIAMGKKERDTLPHKYNFNSDVWNPAALKNIFNVLDCTYAPTYKNCISHFLDFFLKKFFFMAYSISLAWKSTFLASTCTTTRSNFSTFPPKSTDMLQWHRWKFTICVGRYICMSSFYIEDDIIIGKLKSVKQKDFWNTIARYWCNTSESYLLITIIVRQGSLTRVLWARFPPPTGPGTSRSPPFNCFRGRRPSTTPGHGSSECG